MKQTHWLSLVGRKDEGCTGVGTWKQLELAPSRALILGGDREGPSLVASRAEETAGRKRRRKAEWKEKGSGLFSPSLACTGAAQDETLTKGNAKEKEGCCFSECLSSQEKELKELQRRR